MTQIFYRIPSFIFLFIFTLLSGFCSSSHPETKRNVLPFLNFEPSRTERKVLQLIENAQESIEVALYGLENDLVVDSLIEAHTYRGVQIRMVSEFDSEASPSWQKLIEHNIPVHFGNQHGIMHNKYFIIDQSYVFTGSSNLTEGLFHHFNNSILIKDQELAQEYLRDFEIQYEGHYASKKDEGFTDMYSPEDTWEAKLHQFPGSMNLKAYFTPYKKIFPEYLSIGNAPPCSEQCRVKSSSQASLCPDCRQEVCFQESRNGNRLIYLYNNYDKGGERYCSQYNNAMNQVISLIDKAKSSILVLAFAFRDRLMQHKLIQAKKERGVDVRIWIDYNQYRAGRHLSEASFDAVARETNFLKICRKPDGGLLHHKVIVSDRKTVLLGSMNFSQNAVSSNDENFIIIENAPSLAEGFYQEAARIDRYSNYFPETIAPPSGEAPIWKENMTGEF